MKFTVECYDGFYMVKPLTVEDSLGSSPIHIVGKEKLEAQQRIGAIIQVPEHGHGMIDAKLTTDPANPVRWPLRFDRGDVVIYDRAAQINLPMEDGGVLFVPDNAIFAKIVVENAPDLVDPWGVPLSQKPGIVAP